MKKVLLLFFLFSQVAGAKEPSVRTCESDRFWAIEAINGDLMFEAMEEWRSRHPGIAKTKVAIVDSGLRDGFQQQLDAIVSYHNISEEVVKAEEAVSSHGYSVASFYASEAGLYKGANLAIYGVSVPGTDSGVDREAAEASYLDACNKGFQLINASHGGPPSFYADQDEKKKTELLSELASKGCLIIKSAGNSSNRREYLLSEAKPDDAYLRVASVRFSGGLAFHSNVGEISAPGEKIYAYQYSPEGVCKDEKGAMISGTSFAGPIVGAIAANLREVFSANPKFDQISGEKQIALINRYLKGASINSLGLIDGYRAVRLAMIWSGEGSAEVPSIEEIRETQIEDGLCKELGTVQIRGKDFRKILSLCEELPLEFVRSALNRVVVGKDYHLISRVDEALSRAPGIDLSTHRIGRLSYWEDLFSSRQRYQYDGSFIVNEALFRSMLPSKIDFVGAADVYLSLREHIPGDVRDRVDDLLAMEAVAELGSVPEYWSRFPYSSMPPGLFSTEKAANEIGQILSLKIGEGVLAEGLVTNKLEGKGHAFHYTMIFRPYRSSVLQESLRKLLLEPVDGQTPTDLMIYAHTGAVADSHRWLLDVLESPRFFEGNILKADFAYPIELAHQKGFLTDEQMDHLLGVLENRWDEKQSRQTP